MGVRAAGVGDSTGVGVLRAGMEGEGWEESVEEADGRLGVREA